MSARAAYQFYISKGLPPHIAAAFVGNLDIESAGFDPAVINGTRTGDNGSAVGVAQWRGSRLANLKNYAAARGKDWTRLETQLEFTLEEVNPRSRYRDATAAKNWRKIMASENVEEATKAVAKYYERPGKPHLSRRIAAAQRIAMPAQTAMLPENTPAPTPRPEGGDAGDYASLVRPASGGSAPVLPASYSDDAGGLRFAHEWQSGIGQGLRDALTGTSREFGRTLDITSGHRPKAYNRRVGGARNSYHTRGDAADINMAGMDNAARQKLVQELAQRGAGGFITYTNSPDMLHVDMRARPDGVHPHFMHDRSQAHMDNAPGWFREMADAGGVLLPKQAPVPFSPDEAPGGAPMIASADPRQVPRSAPATGILPRDFVQAEPYVMGSVPQTGIVDARPAPFGGETPPGVYQTAGGASVPFRQPARPITPTPAHVYQPANPAPQVAQAQPVPQPARPITPTPGLSAAFPPAPKIAAAPTPVPTPATGSLGSIFSGILSAIGQSAQAVAQADAQAQDAWEENYRASMGPSTAEVAAQMPTDVAMTAMLPLSATPAVPGAVPITAEEILASLFGRPRPILG